MSEFTRREAVAALTAASITSCATTLPPNGHSMTTTALSSGQHQPIPLPFSPTALRGLSERLIVSHHDNNYVGAVRNLNRVELELGQVTNDTPPFVVAALRDKELAFRNSKSLHEAYFGSLGGDGQRSGAIELALKAAHGSSARWEELFRATGAGLAGGSGWVALVLELDTGALRTTGLAAHTNGLAQSLPLLVMDMYEHSYQLDYGAAAAKYIDAFFANLNWDEVNKRFELAVALSTQFRGARG